MRSRILAHRGFWEQPHEKNSVAAFRKAFDHGFGIETDIRDLDGTLVVSHDPPEHASSPLPFTEFLKLYRDCNADGWLALNIKADGLSGSLMRLLAEYGIERAFVFDMSVPDMRGYLNAGAITFSRRSDVEETPSYYEKSRGVWLDSFEIPFSPSNWITQLLSDDKYAALVSPELHGRDHSAAWADWRANVDVFSDSRVMICTDIPTEALEYFQSGQ